MKKRAVILLLITLLGILAISASPLILAQSADETKIENAYLWLVDQIDGKWQNYDTETAALSLLALGYDDRLATDGRNSLIEKQVDDKACWPKPNCKAKDTALAALALNAIGEPTEDETDWLLSREMPFKVSGINWLLQVDAKEGSNCTVTYDSKEYVLRINEDKTYAWASAAPSCLSLVDVIDGSVKSGKYWMKISSGCLDKVYSVSCEDTSVVSIPYVLGDLYVPSETFLTPTDIAIETVCIREGAVCNYESTMWTAYTLMRSDRDYTQFLPYLLGEAENNKHLFPESFLFLMTGKEDHASDLLAKQNRQGYWSQVRGKGKYWDTSMAVLGLFDYAPENITKGMDWLLKNQNSDGSFGTTKKIRDTAFVLSSVWPKAISGGINDCEDVYKYFCRTGCEEDEERVSLSCAIGVCCKSEGLSSCQDIEDCSKSECKGEFVTDVFGRRGQCELSETVCDDDFDNDNDGLTDLDDPDCTVTCFELGGIECGFDEECGVATRKTLETDRCCIGSCIASQVTCASQGGEFCDAGNQKCDGNIISASDASVDSFCCQGDCKSKRSLWPWVIILLVILAAGGVYLQKKGYLDKYLDKFKRTFKKKPKVGERPTYRPPVRPYSAATPAPAGPFQYQHRPAPATRPATRRRPTTKTETELKKTIDKLKRYAKK